VHVLVLTIEWRCTYVSWVVVQIPAYMTVVLRKGRQYRTFISVRTTCSNCRPYYMGWRVGKLSGWARFITIYDHEPTCQTAEYRLLGCDPVYTGTNIQRGTYRLPPQERNVHCTTSHKVVLFSRTATRTSNLT